MKPSEIKDLYARLEISQNASQSEIKTAYRKLAIKYHPDKNQQGEEDFKAISEAYKTLSDPEKKEKYDITRTFYKKHDLNSYANIFKNVKVSEDLRKWAEDIINKKI